VVTGARLLDGFHYGDFNISTFLASLDKPEDALAGIIKPTDLMNHRDRGIPGMLRFMTFCRDSRPRSTPRRRLRKCAPPWRVCSTVITAPHC